MENLEHAPVDRLDLIDAALALEFAYTDIYTSDIPVTLIVNGATWTGELIPFPEFLEAQADYLSSVTIGTEGAETVLESRVSGFREWAEMVRKQIRQDREDQTNDEVSRRFIQLKNAYKVGERGTYPAIRFKLSAVDGWTLGLAQGD